jgi:tryptophanyl-tRNA synthetase
VEEPKDPDSSNIFALYKNFATPEQIENLRARYRKGGLGWGQAKKELFELINAEFTPIREKYNDLMKDQNQIWNTLKEGSEKASKLASEKIKFLRNIIGID